MFANITRVVRAIWAFILCCFYAAKTLLRSSSAKFDLPVVAPIADVFASQVHAAPVVPSVLYPLAVAGSIKQASALRGEVDQFTGGPFSPSSIGAVLGTSAITAGNASADEKRSSIKQTEAIEGHATAQVPSIPDPIHEDTARIADDFKQVQDAIFDTPRKQKDKWSNLLDKCVAHFSVTIGDESTDITVVSKVRVVGDLPELVSSTPASSPSLSSDSGSGDESETSLPSTPSDDIARFLTFRFPPPFRPDTHQCPSHVFDAPAAHTPRPFSLTTPLSLVVDEEPKRLGEGSPVAKGPSAFTTDFPAADCLFERIEPSISFSSLLASPCDESPATSSDSNAQPEDLGDDDVPSSIVFSTPNQRIQPCASDLSVAELWGCSPVRSYVSWSPPPRPPPRQALPRTTTSPLRTHAPSICDMV